MKGLGALQERVALDASVKAPDGMGGHTYSWQQAFLTRAEFRYQRGEEAVEAGGLTGTARFKVRIRSHGQSRAVTPEHRLRDLRRNIAYNIREVDAVTDRHWVWLVVESGVAV